MICIVLVFCPREPFFFPLLFENRSQTLDQCKFQSSSAVLMPHCIVLELLIDHNSGCLTHFVWGFLNLFLADSETLVDARSGFGEAKGLEGRRGCFFLYAVVPWKARPGKGERVIVPIPLCTCQAFTLKSVMQKQSSTCWCSLLYEITPQRRGSYTNGFADLCFCVCAISYLCC